jgi:hypothetical protein
MYVRVCVRARARGYVIVGNTDRKWLHGRIKRNLEDNIKISLKEVLSEMGLSDSKIAYSSGGWGYVKERHQYSVSIKDKIMF